MRGGITRSPKNVATKVRQSVTLQCDGHNHSEMLWDKKRTDGFYNTLATQKWIKATHKHGLIDEKGHFDLVLKSPVLSDSGTYRCKEVWTTTDYGVAEVIVFGKI